MEEENLMVNDPVTKKIQNKTLEMLITFSELMQKNNITFYLACGTALGCARHQGFIPWDDDVDLYIYGKDYDKIKKVFLEQDTKNLVLHDPTTVKDYPFWFPKIVAKDTYLKEKYMQHLSYKSGVYIDLFPLTEVSNNTLVRFGQEQLRYLEYFLIRGTYAHFDSKIRQCFCSVLRFVTPISFIQKRLYKHYSRQVPNCKYLADGSLFGKKSLLDPNIFRSIKYLPFEKNMLPMPELYEKYLVCYYGDWRSLPKKEDRISEHEFVDLKI